MQTDLFQSCGHCWVFQICWHIECNTFTASSFRIWNSSTGIPSPPLALFVVMLSKAYLTSYSRMSGSRWVITPSWLSVSWMLYVKFNFFPFFWVICRSTVMKSYKCVLLYRSGLFSKVVIPFYISLSSVWGFLLLYILGIFYFSHSSGCIVISHCDFNLHFPVD